MIVPGVHCRSPEVSVSATLSFSRSQPGSFTSVFFQRPNRLNRLRRPFASEYWLFYWDFGSFPVREKIDYKPILQAPIRQQFNKMIGMWRRYLAENRRKSLGHWAMQVLFADVQREEKKLSRMRRSAAYFYPESASQVTVPCLPPLALLRKTTEFVDQIIDHRRALRWHRAYLLGRDKAELERTTRVL